MKVLVGGAAGYDGATVVSSGLLDNSDHVGGLDDPSRRHARFFDRIPHAVEDVADPRDQQLHMWDDLRWVATVHPPTGMTP